MKNIFILITCLLVNVLINAQGVGINTTAPHKSSLLDMKSHDGKFAVGLPKVHLTSDTDVSIINGGVPAEGLIIYNTNENVAGGKGIYFWNPQEAQWEYAVSQANIELFRDLTRYYTEETQYATSVSTTPVSSNNHLYTQNASTTNWTMLKKNGTTNLEIPIKVEQVENFIEINLSGTWLAYRNSDQSAVSRSYEVGYGIFVDGQLKYAKVDNNIAPNSCNIANFYVNAVIPNIATGSHTISFGVMLRRIGSDGGTTFPNNTTLQVGGVSSGATSGCKSINAFEASTKATVLVNNVL